MPRGMRARGSSEFRALGRSIGRQCSTLTCVAAESDRDPLLCGRHSPGNRIKRSAAMSVTFPGESAEYRAARDRLLAQEIELRRAMEAVAASRRLLPPGGPVKEDYVFHAAGPDGAPVSVKLSELFDPGKNSLVIYSFMFPRDPSDTSPGPAFGKTALLTLEEGPCPSCTALLDQLD